MLKFWMVTVWLSSLLACCGCQAPRTRAVTPCLTTVSLSADACTAVADWIRAGPARRAGSIADTGSMKPALDEHSVVIVERRSFGRLRSGDIVLINARWAGSRVAHRLTHRLPVGWWITCGDANQAPDPLMREQDYAGEVVIAAINKLTGSVRIFDRPSGPDASLASVSPPPAGGAFKSRIVCAKEF